MKQAQKISFINGPVYLDADSRNCFNVRLEKVNTLKELAGPFYVKSDSKHAFSELLKKVDNAKTIIMNCRNKLKTSGDI